LTRRLPSSATGVTRRSVKRCHLPGVAIPWSVKTPTPTLLHALPATTQLRQCLSPKRFLARVPSHRPSPRLRTQAQCPRMARRIAYPAPKR
jgi:hypothetical protein